MFPMANALLFKCFYNKKKKIIEEEMLIPNDFILILSSEKKINFEKC